MLPTLNILVYTDYADWFTETPLEPTGAFTDLKLFVTDKTKQSVEVHFTFVSRHSTNPPTLITEALLTGVHELWVFGYRLNDKDGEPDNKLKDSEVCVLKELINQAKLGIFLTGDHSVSEVDAKCSEVSHDDFSSLGRALGERIPIAGMLRDWQGPPTNCNEGEFDQRDTFNTQEGPNPCELDASSLESDPLAQNIILTIKNCLPHRLFTIFDSNEDPHPITKLPDHTHEGRVLDADEVRERFGDQWRKEWPDPVVVAKGRDKRFPNENRISNLVVAFDGDSAGLSRMVVDSSFHHYLDYNLFAIPARAPGSRLPEPGSDLDQIATYFGNLAKWLAPKSIRTQLKLQILLSLTRHMAVRQVWNLSELKVGAAARAVLKQTIGKGRLQWLLGWSPFEEERDLIDDVLEVLLLGDANNSLFSKIVKPELPLGVALRICDQFLLNNKAKDVSQVADLESLSQSLQGTLFVTLDTFRTELSKQSPISASAIENSLALFKQSKGEK